MDSSPGRSTARWIEQKGAVGGGRADDVVARVDRDGTVEWVDPGWFRMDIGALSRFVSRPIRESLAQIDLDASVVDFVSKCIRDQASGDVDLQRISPEGSKVRVTLRIEPRRDASGDVRGFELLAHDLMDRKQVADLAGLRLVNLSTLAVEMARRYVEDVDPSTALDLALTEDVPCVVANEWLLEGLVARLICRAIDSTRGSWSALSISTGLVGSDPGPLYRGNLVDALPHDQYAYLEVHDTGNSSATARHRPVEEPFLSRRYGGEAMCIAHARRLLQSQGGEIFLESNGWDGNSVVLALPYCVAHGLEGR